MLSRRFHKLLKIAERRTILRLYITGDNVHSNLSTIRINPTRNLYNSSRKMIIPTLRCRTWNTVKQNKIITRSLHPMTQEKKIDDSVSENGLAYNILNNCKRIFKTISLRPKPTESLSDDEIERLLCEDWTNSSADETLKAFEQLSYSAKLKSECLNEYKHSQFLQAFKSKLTELNDEQLRNVFGYLSLWNKLALTKFPAYVTFWSQLDQECLARLPRWNQEEALLMCDCWYSIRLAKKASFTLTVLQRLGKKPRQLNPTNFLHYMFVVNTCRRPPINVYELEYHLSHILDQYNVNELGIIAMAFFKCQTPIRDQNIITTMHHRIMADIDNVEDVALNAIMKITRYSTGLRDLDVFRELLVKLIPQVPKLSIPCLTNIVHATAYVQVHNPELMNAIIAKFEENINEARIKDLERLAWALGIFAYDRHTPIYNKIIESMRDPKRELELTLYPKTLPTILTHLSFTNIFPIDLIKRAFDPDFLSRVYENNSFKIGRDYFALENNIKIDLPEYDGPLLTPTVRDFLSKGFRLDKMYSHSKMNYAEKFTMEVAHMCKSAMKPDTPISIEQVLPHFVKSDIIMCFDEANNPVDPEPILSKTIKGSIKFIPDEAKHLKWLAVILATQNQMIRGEDKIIGPMNCKIHQLQKIGYTPIMMNITEWYNMSTLEMKSEYMREKLCRALDHEISKQRQIDSVS